MHLWSLKMSGMLKMLCMVVMVMTLMDIVCGLSLHMVGEDAHHRIATAITVAEVIEVDHPSILTIEDHMRRAGEVCFSNVYKDRRYGGMVGIVDYAYYEDMKRAIRKLDDSEFHNAFSRAYIQVREYSRSPSPKYRSRSRSYSPGRSHSRSHSYSLSPRRTSRHSYSRSPVNTRSMSCSRCVFRSSSLQQSGGLDIRAWICWLIEPCS